MAISDDCVVSNSMMMSHEDFTEVTPAQESSSPKVTEKLDVRIKDKLKKLHIGLVLALVLIAALFFAVAALCVAFSVEISQLKSSDSDAAEQQTTLSAIADRLHSLNSSMDALSQQLLQVVNGGTQLVANPQDNSSLLQDIVSQIQLVNSSLEMLSQQLFQGISEGNSRTQQVNSSLEILSQQLRQDISAAESRTQQVNSSLELLSQQLPQAISAVDSSVQQVNISLLQEVHDVLNQTQQIVADLEVLGQLQTFPASSCAAILPSSPSGYYWLRASNGSAVSVYCDMTLTCGGVTGGWARVVQLDFTNNSDPCPSGFTERIDSSLRTCTTVDDSPGCYSTEFSTSSINYLSVCGRVIAYQLGTPEAFARTIVLSSLTIASQYLDGISLTHGNPMEHIWSFAAGVTESRTDRFGCPCNVGSTASVMGTFIGMDYFCDSAAQEVTTGVFYPNDPLWDGEGCAPSNGCCSFNNPPWFYKQLPQSTSDDIEMRVCRDESGTTEGVPIEIIEIYVQ